jgi:hypothetical protein
MAIEYQYSSTRIGDASGGLPANASLGDVSASDTQTEDCSVRSAIFRFPDRFDLMQGTWSVTVTVTTVANDGTRASQFGGTCTSVRIPVRTLQWIKFTQMGQTGGCTFSP